MYLLDTNTCIRYLNGRSPEVVRRLQSLRPSDIALCSVVKAVLFYGSSKSKTLETTLKNLLAFAEQFVCFPFDDEAARYYGPLRADLEKAGTPIGPYDLQIAYIALSRNLILVTHNVREFSRVVGLQYEDWED